MNANKEKEKTFLNHKEVTVSKEGNFSRSSASLLKEKSVRNQINAFAKISVKRAHS